MARLKEIVVSCASPQRLARFWAGVLRDYMVRPYDAAEIARLAAAGLTPDSDPVVMVDGPGPSLCFQRAPATSGTGVARGAAPGTGRQTIHLDIVGAARPAEVARIMALGGRVRDENRGYTVMLDPEGNAFCVQDPPSESVA